MQLSGRVLRFNPQYHPPPEKKRMVRQTFLKRDHGNRNRDHCKGWGRNSVQECLSSIRKVLGSIPTTKRSKNKKKKGPLQWSLAVGERDWVAVLMVKRDHSSEGQPGVRKTPTEVEWRWWKVQLCHFQRCRCHSPLLLSSTHVPSFSAAIPRPFLN